MFLIDCSFIGRFTSKDGIFFLRFWFWWFIHAISCHIVKTRADRLFFLPWNPAGGKPCNDGLLGTSLDQAKTAEETAAGPCNRQNPSQISTFGETRLSLSWNQAVAETVLHPVGGGLWVLGLGTGERLCKTWNLKLWLRMTWDCLHMSTVHGFVHLMATSEKSNGTKMQPKLDRSTVQPSQWTASAVRLGSSKNILWQSELLNGGDRERERLDIEIRERDRREKEYRRVWALGTAWHLHLHPFPNLITPGYTLTFSCLEVLDSFVFHRHEKLGGWCALFDALKATATMHVQHVQPHLKWWLILI